MLPIPQFDVERSVFETVPARWSGSASIKGGKRRKRKPVDMLHSLVIPGPAGFQPAAARLSALTSKFVEVGKVVRHAGSAPAPAVWKTDMLLLHQ